eukprot:scaffold75697_cov17-Tisochrysis_lutea.AAC.1
MQSCWMVRERARCRDALLAQARVVYSQNCVCASVHVLPLFSPVFAVKCPEQGWPAKPCISCLRCWNACGVAFADMYAVALLTQVQLCYKVRGRGGCAALPCARGPKRGWAARPCRGVSAVLEGQSEGGLRGPAVMSLVLEPWLDELLVALKTIVTAAWEGKGSAEAKQSEQL